MCWYARYSLIRIIPIAGWYIGTDRSEELATHKKPADSLLLGCSSRSPDNEGHASPKYSDRLSPAINMYLSEASRQEVRVCPTFT
ncbi:hypothetical protein BHE74_00010766 [Ensete ventricosum]|nr:hypothetical protein BHE74_00010766 [Ensete ventricosum]